MLRWLGLVAVLFAPTLPAVAARAADLDYLQQLQEIAAQRQLAAHPQWRALLHYRGTPDNATSEIDAPYFFAAPNGKRDPQAELDATLAAFFSASLHPEKQEHPQCAFVARYRWLAQELRFDATKLPPQDCERFADWHGRIAPHSLSVIFPAAYLNNPSSMFGHTLLRFDSEGLTEKTHLLAYAVNYAATTGTDNGVLFAVKGIVGAYPGYVSVSPYYDKVNTYAEIENRDIWEYELRLTPGEVTRILEHVWELRGVYADYYFFDENCSYELLTLLDVARPSLDLASQTRPWVIPTDTIRLLQQAQLITRANYRPSAATRLRATAQQLSRPERDLARGIAEGKLDANSPQLAPDRGINTAAVLTTAYEYQKYQVLSGKWSRQDVVESTRDILVALSQTTSNQQQAEPPTPKVRPDQGHGTALLGLGLGELDDAPAVLLRLRPAYHDLLDPTPGYVDGAQIKFLDTHVAYRTDEHSWMLERLDLVDIVSLSPRDAFFRPTSWSVRSGWYRVALPMALDRRDLTFVVDAGAGLTHASNKTQAYAMLKGALDVNNDLQHGASLGAGVSIGLLVSPAPRWKLGLAGALTRFGIGDSYTRSHVELDTRLHFEEDQQLQLSVSHTEASANAFLDIKLNWSWFY